LPFYPVNVILVFCNAVVSPIYIVLRLVGGSECNFEIYYERDVSVFVLEGNGMKKSPIFSCDFKSIGCKPWRLMELSCVECRSKNIGNMIRSTLEV